MEEIKVLIEKEKLKERVKEIAKEIERDYNKEEIILICVLKGATYFTIDLSKKIKNCDVLLDFIKVKSYNTGDRKSSGTISFNLDISQDIKNKNVIIVEDIIDSGYTLNYLYNYLKEKEPKSLKICVLLDKKERREKEIKVDYTGFVIEDKFVVGYGMDCDEKYRNLDYIGYIEN